jgi:hypothetical protein
MNFPGTGGSASPLGVMGGGMAGGMDAQQIQEAQMVKTVSCVLYSQAWADLEGHANHVCIDAISNGILCW